MVEPIMYMAIGFLVSMLIGLMIFPLVHNRAVRLTTKRLEAAAPVSRAEIQADKDQLRAEFAVNARRLELTIEQLKSKATGQLAELGKKTDAVNRLKIELGEKSAAILALQAREQELQHQLRTTTDEASAKSQSLLSTEQTLGERQDELARLTADLAYRTQDAENLGTELGAAKVTIETLTGRIEARERELASTEQQLAQQRIEAATTTSELADARGRVEQLSQRIADLDRQLVEQVRETETRIARADELQNSLTEKETLIAMRDDEAARLHQSHGAALRSVQELRSQIAGGEQAATAADLQAENALLRDRINDIAADVARLALSLEGPDSPIEAIMAASGSVSKAGNGSMAQATLADRIRALQARTAESPQPRSR